MSNPYQRALRQQKRFWQLQFSPKLEREFMQYRLDHYIPRIRLLAYTAVAMLLMYTYMDYVQFSDSILIYTVLLRLCIDAPLIVAVLIASYKFRNPIYFYYLLGFAYLINGISILIILFMCHLNGIALPYEGLFLLLMFGYFLLGMPLLHSTLVSIAVSLGYVLGEYLIKSPPQQIFYPAFFLTSANIVGIVGAFLLERLSRTNFLYLKQAELAREEALQDVSNRSRFIAAASHDLRQPIHALGLMIDRLHNHPDEVRQTTPRLHQAHEQLNELLTSLLDISRLDFGLVAPTTNTIQLSQLMAVIPQHTNIHIDVSDAVWVASDRVLLGRIIGNLVTNALRHAQASRIDILAWPEGDKIRLVIQDDGVGMDEETKQNIFSPYERGNHDQQGLGLGLAIVKELCTLMNIPMTLICAPNEGCRFELVLPASSKGPALNTVHLPSRALNVVLLEDNDQQRMYVEAMLKDWGHQVFCPTPLSPPQAHLPFETHLILADYEISCDTTGLDWINKLREQHPGLPALLVSANGNPELRQMCIEQDVSFLPKPVTPVSLKVWLERHSVQ